MRKILVISGKLRHGKDTLAKFILDNLQNQHQPCKKCYNTGFVETCKDDSRVLECIDCDCSNNIISYKTAFADPIKRIAQTMFPQIKGEDLWGPSENRNNIVKDCVIPNTEKPLTVRDVLVFIGKYGRKCNKNCWINSTFGYINNNFSENSNIIISDGRFLNELEFSKNHGAKIVRIIRPDIINFDTNQDESEINLDNVPLSYYDYVVYNTSLEKLKEEAAKISSEYFL